MYFKIHIKTRIQSYRHADIQVGIKKQTHKLKILPIVFNPTGVLQLAVSTVST